MGLYDRDYYRQEQSGFALRKPRTVIGALILINVGIYLLCAIIGQSELGYDELVRPFALTVGTLTHPLMWWQFLSYGFMHAWTPIHVIFNMAGLWFLGRDVEARYGSKEFLCVYLAMIVVGGLAWAGCENFQGANPHMSVVGASAAVTGVVLLFACNFPRATLLLFGIIPMPAWFLGLFVVGENIYGSLGGRALEPMANIAYTGHIGGAVLAGLYFWFGWRFSGWLDLRRWRLKSTPWLRIHAPRDEADSGAHRDADGADKKVDAQVDQILEKIHNQGEASLTRKERRILESASREYQRRRQE